MELISKLVGKPCFIQILRNKLENTEKMVECCFIFPVLPTGVRAF